MRTALTIMTLFSFALGAGAQKPADARPKRSALFIGKGTASWLPSVEILPTALDIEAAAKNLGARQRNLDPFGLAVFPREDAAPAFFDDTLREAPRVTLNQVLQSLKINGVNLARKEFLIGGRNVVEGDVIEMTFKGETFQAQVIEVGHTELRFRNLLRDETGVLLHSMIPALPLEPMHKIASRLDGKVSPMEPANPKSP